MTGSTTDPLAAFHTGPPPRLECPLALVHGNCQAESLRVMLDSEALATVRIPPVHELTAHDLPLLRRWLARSSVLVSQPVRPGYRGMAIGTADVIAAGAATTRVVIVPVVRFAGLYPELAIVRPPHDPAAVPPLVPYHSLRTLARAAGRRLAPLRPSAVREIAAASVAELRRRERDHGTVVVSDLFGAPRFSLMRTTNHPGNPVWCALAARVCDALGIDAQVSDPGRPLLDAVHAPRDPAVIEAFSLSEDPERDWRVDGTRVSSAEVSDVHLAWYARHPETVAAGLERHRRALAAIGMR